MENTEVIVGAMIGILIGAVIAGLVIWIISKLKLGLEVKNFGWAMLAGVLIGLFTNLINGALPESGGVTSFVVSLLVSAVVILAWGKVLKGLTVDGFTGALVAALAIAAINFLAGMFLVAA